LTKITPNVFGCLCLFPSFNLNKVAKISEKEKVFFWQTMWMENFFIAFCDTLLPIQFQKNKFNPNKWWRKFLNFPQKCVSRRKNFWSVGSFSRTNTKKEIHLWMGYDILVWVSFSWIEPFFSFFVSWTSSCFLFGSHNSQENKLGQNWYRYFEKESLKKGWSLRNRRN